MKSFYLQLLTVVGVMYGCKASLQTTEGQASEQQAVSSSTKTQTLPTSNTSASTATTFSSVSSEGTSSEGTSAEEAPAEETPAAASSESFSTTPAMSAPAAAMGFMDIPTTIDQRGSQADPTAVTPIIFDVTFTEPLNPDSFTSFDIVNEGSATIGALTVTNNGDEMNYTVTITSMTSDGTIQLTLPQGSVEGLIGFTNANSTSTDNSVVFESSVPAVTINQASGQADPAISFPIEFDIAFSEPINNATFDISDVTQTGTATGVVWSLVNSGDDQNYTLQVTDFASAGTIVPTIAANLVSDLFANLNTASTSTDGEVTYLKAIDNLASGSKSSSSIGINWTAPAHNTVTIVSYDVYYRLDGATTWTFFENTTNLSSNITGLTASTFYEFTVVVNYNAGASDYGVDSTTVDGSIYLRTKTGPNLPLFDPDTYTAINVGGADDSRVVAMVDGTTVNRNGSFLATLNAGQTADIASSQFDLIEADQPIYVSGGIGSGGGASGAHISWHTPAWAGTEFHFNSDRDPPFRISVWAAEAADVSLDGVLQLSLAAQGGNSFTVPAAGSYTITSTGLVMVYIWGESGAANRYTDPMPLFPAAKDVVGFASTRAYLTDNSSVTSCIHSDGSSCSINTGTIPNFSPVGTSSYYQANATRILSTDPIFVRSRADQNGYCGAPFVPRAYMRSMYAINVDSTYVALASVTACTVEVLNTAGTVVETIVLNRTGSGDAPFFGRTGTTGSNVGTNTLQGYIFRAANDGFGNPSCEFAAWYQPGVADLDGGENDETILFGTNDFISY